jgi:hypothetical protein
MTGISRNLIKKNSNLVWLKFRKRSNTLRDERLAFFAHLRGKPLNIQWGEKCFRNLVLEKKTASYIQYTSSVIFYVSKVIKKKEHCLPC